MNNICKKYVFAGLLIISLCALYFVNNGGHEEYNINIYTALNDIRSGLVPPNNGSLNEDTSIMNHVIYTESEPSQTKSTNRSFQSPQFSSKSSDISSFLAATPDDVILAPKVTFISDVTNPCFAYTPTGNGSKPVAAEANVTFDEVLRNKLTMACLPYVYLAGFTKSGTSNFFKYFTMHPRIAIGETKELHWWDNMKCNPDLTINNFVDKMAKGTVAVKQALKKDPTKQILLAEGSPRTVWNGDHWHYDVINHNLSEPIILSPQKIHHVTPQSRIIVIMRDPTLRLISDYKYYVRMGRRVSSEDFHDKVTRAIEWWKTCLQTHSKKQCLYGHTPQDMPQLDIDNCIENRTHVWQYTTNPKLKICHNYWQWLNNTAARLRVGLYADFITEWLHVFPREQMYFVKFEDYVKNQLDTLQNGIYPFLGLPKITGPALTPLKNLISKDTGSNKSGKKFKAFPKTIEMLNEFYSPYNKRLCELLGDSNWNWTQ